MMVSRNRGCIQEHVQSGRFWKYEIWRISNIYRIYEHYLHDFAYHLRQRSVKAVTSEIFYLNNDFIHRFHIVDGHLLVFEDLTSKMTNSLLVWQLCNKFASKKDLLNLDTTVRAFGISRCQMFACCKKWVSCYVLLLLPQAPVPFLYLCFENHFGISHRSKFRLVIMIQLF